MEVLYELSKEGIVLMIVTWRSNIFALVILMSVSGVCLKAQKRKEIDDEEERRGTG